MSRATVLVVVLSALAATAAHAQDETYYRQGADAYNAARELAKQKQFAEAAEAYVQFAEDYAEHEAADDALLAASQLCYNNLNQPQRCVALAEQLDKAYPQSAKLVAALNLAGNALYHRAREYEKAGPFFERVARDFPGYTGREGALITAIHCRRNAKDHEGVARLADVYLQRWPSGGTRRLEVLMYKGIAFAAMNDVEKLDATAAEMEKIEGGSRHVGAMYYSAAGVLNGAGERTQAARAYARAADYDAYENASVALYSAGNVARAAGPEHAEQAIQYYRQCMMQYPGGTYEHYALLLIAETYRTVDKRDHEIEAYREFVQKFPDSVMTDRVKYQLAQGLVAAGQLDAARKAYRDVFENHPKSDYADESLLLLARILRDANEPGGAKLLYRRAAEDYRGTPNADTARREMERMKR